MDLSRVDGIELYHVGVAFFVAAVFVFVIYCAVKHNKGPFE